MLLNKRYYLIFLAIIILLFTSSCKKQAEGFNSIGNLYNLGFVTQDKNYIYYLNLEKEEGSLCKMNLNGTNKKVVFNVEGFYLNNIQEWIYYINMEDNKIYRVLKNGEKNEKISNLKASMLFEYKKQLYFQNENYNNLYTMNYDGTALRKIIEGKCYNLFPYNNYIYFSFVNMENQKTELKRINLKNNNIELIISDIGDIYKFYIYNETFYYINNFGLIKIDMENLNKTTLLKNIKTSDMIINFYNNKIYFNDLYTQTLYCYDLETEQNKKIKSNVNFESLFLLNGGFLYYEDDRLFLEVF